MNMKKLIIIILLLISVSATAQTYYGNSYANKAYANYLYADTVMSNITFDKIVTMDSTTNIKIPYGVFSDTTTQTVVSTSGRYGVNFSNNDEVYKITHTAGDTLFTIQEEGLYFIMFSAVVDITSGVNNHVDIWLLANGNDVPRSNTYVEIPAANIEMVVAASFIYGFRAGETFCLMYGADDTDARLKYTPAGTTPVTPISPSVILTVYKIGRRL